MLRNVQIARLAFQHSPEKEQRLLSFANPPKSNANAGQHTNETNDRNFEKAPFNPEDKVLLGGMQSVVRQRLAFLNDLANVDLKTADIDALNSFYERHASTLSESDLLGRRLSQHDDVRSTIDSLMNDVDVQTELETWREVAAEIAEMDFNSRSPDARRQMIEFFTRNEVRLYSMLGPRFHASIAALKQQLEGQDRPNALRSTQKEYLVEYVIAPMFYETMGTLREEQEAKRPKGPRLSYCSEAEMKTILEEAKSTMPVDEYGALIDSPPSAFIYKGIIHFNLDHPRNRNEEERRNTIAHEITHFEIDRKTRGPAFLKKFENYFKEKGVWDGLKEAVDGAYANSGGFTGTDEDYMHEIMAIYTADSVQPEDKENLRKICDLVASVFAPPLSNEAQTLDGLLSDLTSSVRTSYEQNADSVDRGLSQGISEKDEAKIAMEVLAREKARRNPDEKKKDEAKKQINAHKEGDSVTEDLTPATLSAKIREVITKGEALKGRMKDIRNKIGILPPKQRAESDAGLTAVNKLVDDNLPDLYMFDSWMDTLERWDTPEDEGGPTDEQRMLLTERCGFGRTTTLTEEQRAEILAIVNELIVEVAAPLKDVEDFEKADLPVPKEKDKREKSYWKWMKENIFTSGNGIEWMSIYDVIKVFEIHKEAWVAKYKENQERRTYRVAKDTNFRKDIQSTLEKQARSANEKQTSEFNDYLKTSGLNYMQLMGPNGLYYKLSNINQKRAVLEFAAEKAWLYDLDPLNGRDVYGIDFAGEFGPEAFVHLVQAYEGGKSKEEKRGHEKVNKRPDIPPMIEDLIHELHDKNLFAAKGIFKRIQEKAKITHSSLWAMTTLLSQLRKDPDLLKTLDKGLLDDLGNIGIGESAWGLTMFKFLRHDLMKLKTGAEFGTTCILDKTIDKIEKRIRKDYGNEPYFPKQKIRNMEEAVAYVLAGKTIVDKSKNFTLSIFETDYDDYRKWWLDNANTTTSAAKTDDDFFGPEGSDVMLTGEAIIKEVGTRDSTGRPTHQRKAPNFYASVIDRYDDLKQNSPAALPNFRREMQGKFKQWLRTYVSSNAATAGQMPQEKDGKDRYLLDEMLARGIFLEEDIIGTLRENIFSRKKDDKTGEDKGPKNPEVYNRITEAIKKGKREMQTN